MYAALQKASTALFKKHSNFKIFQEGYHLVFLQENYIQYFVQTDSRLTDSMFEEID